MASINTSNTLTGYGVAKMANRELKRLGYGKEIPPQMVYNYIKKGFIPSVTVEGQTRVTREAAEVWVSKYTTRLSARKGVEA